MVITLMHARVIVRTISDPNLHLTADSFLIQILTQVLPTDGMNINMLNIKESIFSACCAFHYPVEKSSFLGSSGLNVLTHKGASEQELIHHGNK